MKGVKKLGGEHMISVRNLNHSFKIGKKGKEKQVPVLKGTEI